MFFPTKPADGFRVSPSFEFERRGERIVALYRGKVFMHCLANDLANTMFGHKNVFTWGQAFEADAMDIVGYGFMFAHRVWVS